MRQPRKLMQQLVQRVGLALFAAGVLLISAAGARAAEEHVVNKVVVTTTDGKEQKLDLTKPEDRKKLDLLLTEGRVEHLSEAKDPAILDLRWDLGLWTIVVFLLLFFVLRKMAWGPILEGLKKREDNIRLAVEEAKIARAETEKIRADFKAQMDKAYAEIPKIMDEARREAQQLADDMRAKANADIATERQRLRREIDTARDQALKELQDFSADLATRISSKVLKRAVSADDHRRLVDDAMKELLKPNGKRSA
jgi:F-type H+-transporting ATPase subunit b